MAKQHHIPERSFHVKRWIMLYLTRHRYATIRQLYGAGAYDRAEIRNAADELLATEWIREQNGQLEPVEPWSLMI